MSPLIFKEIYYCGSRPEKGGVYFRDQFYEIYNNSADILYLDGIYFANLTPGTASHVNYLFGRKRTVIIMHMENVCGNFQEMEPNIR